MSSKIIKLFSELKSLPQNLKNFGYLQSFAFLLYQIVKQIGLYHIITPKKNHSQKTKINTISPFKFPDIPVSKKNFTFDKEEIKKTNAHLLNGEFLSFGMVWQPLVFLNPNSDLHWSKAKTNLLNNEIKNIWEPARFNWSLLFARAYLMTSDKVFYVRFRELLIKFISENPVNCGVNWQSGQEIALRLINLSIAYSIFWDLIKQDDDFQNLIIPYLKEHASRIKSTLIYAYAQNNNHLLSEAVGMLTASVIFCDDKQMLALRKAGIFWINYCLTHQFKKDGAYLQHSTNYHRMVLDLLMWVRFLERHTSTSFINNNNLFIIQKAVNWLFANTDYMSGEMANYGHNDGTYLFQFNDCDYRDARPTLQAVCRAYGLNQPYENGYYDEKAFWFNFDSSPIGDEKPASNAFRLGDEISWAVLRVDQFTTRPGHADQNHVDLWFKGKNVVCDAGTYSYNLPDPWHNELAKTKVHNTITIEGLDQMESRGTFRWRNWSCGVIKRNEDKKSIFGKHTGYYHLGIEHSRELINCGDGQWFVMDSLKNNKTKLQSCEICSHWLILDCDFKLDSPNKILFSYEGMQLEFAIECDQNDIALGIFRAGICIQGNFKNDPNLGWYSPTYLLKEPALSIVSKIKSNHDLLVLKNRFSFTKC